MKDLRIPRSILNILARRLTSSLVCLLLCSSIAFSQLANHINSAPDTPVSGTNASDYDTYALPSALMTGATVDLHWNSVDTGSATSGCPSISFSTFDSSLSTIITDGSGSGKFINFIVMPVLEGGSNDITPAYVFTQLWANNLADGGCSGLGSGDVLVWSASEPVLPGNYIYVNSRYWQETNQPWSSSNQFVGTCTTGTTEPAFLSTASSYTDNNCTWTNVGTNAPPQDVCFSSYYSGNFGGNTGCYNVNDLPSGETLTNLETGFPVSYETPMKTAYKNFIQQVITHYQTSPPTGLKLGYIRFGLSEGGETVPIASQYWPYFKNPTGEGPSSGASIVYLSYDYEMMLFENNNNQVSGSDPAIPLQADMNAWDGINDYPDQEATYATGNNIGIGTNGLQVSDVTSINAIGCTSSSTSTYPVSGDWCYNFHRYCATTMPNGNYPICSLQTLQLSTPGDNSTTADQVGSLSDEYWENGSTWENFPGLIPTAEQNGANNLEIYTCDILYTVMYAYPTNNYPGSSNCGTNGNAANGAYETDYQNTFALFLNSSQPGIYSPVPGAAIQSDSSVTLSWHAYSGASSYAMEIGAAEGGAVYVSPVNVGTALSHTFSLGSSPPTTGDPVWVRWRALNSTGGILLQVDYHFVAP
jgi:hypothetical protein